MNGFGRFGLHMLKYWLDRGISSNFVIQYINDDFLSAEKIYSIILKDEAVIFNKYKVTCFENIITFTEPSGETYSIKCSNLPKKDIPWLGKPDMVFECSGKSTSKKDCKQYIKGSTKCVLISATSWDADATLVFGFNHKDYNSSHEIISYGSCTVNAYVPLANYINNQYGIEDSDVNVIHNIQSHRLDENYTLIRKFCTLEKSGQNLLKCINKDNFAVNYTVIPYPGVSMIDFRFRVKRTPTKKELINDFELSCADGELKGLYGIDEVDIGPEIYNCTTFSSAIIKENIRLNGDNIYLPAYFDNENSVNRYYDLAQYLSSQLS